MTASHGNSSASVVPLFPAKTRNGETAEATTAASLAREARCIQLKAEVRGQLSAALSALDLQAQLGEIARASLLRDLRRLQLTAEVLGKWSVAVRALALAIRYRATVTVEERSRVEAYRLAA